MGIVFGLAGYWAKADDDESINPRKLLRTVAMWVAAALVVAFEPNQTLTEAGIEAQLTAVGFIGTWFDVIWSALEDYDRFPDWLSTEYPVPTEG